MRHILAGCVYWYTDQVRCAFAWLQLVEATKCGCRERPAFASRGWDRRPWASGSLSSRLILSGGVRCISWRLRRLSLGECQHKAFLKLQGFLATVLSPLLTIKKSHVLYSRWTSVKYLCISFPSRSRQKYPETSNYAARKQKLNKTFKFIMLLFFLFFT